MSQIEHEPDGINDLYIIAKFKGDRDAIAASKVEIQAQMAKLHTHLMLIKFACTIVLFVLIITVAISPTVGAVLVWFIKGSLVSMLLMFWLHMRIDGKEKVLYSEKRDHDKALQIITEESGSDE